MKLTSKKKTEVKIMSKMLDHTSRPKSAKPQIVV